MHAALSKLRGKRGASSTNHEQEEGRRNPATPTAIGEGRPSRVSMKLGVIQFIQRTDREDAA